MDSEYFSLFDAGIDRAGTGAVKWDAREEHFGRADVIPLWVADMDFPSPAAVREALIERAMHGAYGYTVHGRDEAEAVASWMKRRHDLDISPDWVLNSPGVVDSMLFVLKALTKPGDTIIVQPPVYGPFYAMAEKAGLNVYRNRLVETPAGWRMDLNDLEEGLKKGAKVAMICSPHNPVGRVWTKAELADLAALCKRYGAKILADEIHEGFVMPGHTHTPILSVPGAEDAVMLISATKTFNLAGLNQSSILAPDEETRKAIGAVMGEMGACGPNIFGALAQKTAFLKGEKWLDELVLYLDGNRQMAEDFINREIAPLRATHLEGTYLLWVDARGLHTEEETLRKLFVEKGGVGLNPGSFFGAEGRGFMRLNLAAPRRQIEAGLAGMWKAVAAL